MALIPPITIVKNDFEKLSNLLISAPESIQELLQNELDRATVVEDGHLPDGIVAMHSKVTYLDEETGKEATLTLVYPHEADVEAGKVSVLAPVGAALIGMKVGKSIQWPMPHGKEKLIKVVAVTK